MICIWSTWCHCHPSSLSSLKSRMFYLYSASLPRLSWKKRPFNRFSSLSESDIIVVMQCVKNLFCFQELIQLIKRTRIPIICICNEKGHTKIRSLSNYCFDLRFQRPRVEQIKVSDGSSVPMHFCQMSFAKSVCWVCSYGRRAVKVITVNTVENYSTFSLIRMC